MQLEELKAFPDVTFMKMCDTGEWFKQQFPDKTPATSVSALDDWATNHAVQSVYYDCQNYMANIIRHDTCISIRYFYLFNERIAENYLDIPCDTWDATYENLPVVNTFLWQENGHDNKGLILDEQGCPFTIEKTTDQTLSVKWQEKSVLFSETEIRIHHLKQLIFDFTGSTAEIDLVENIIMFHYKNSDYRIIISGAKLQKIESGCIIEAIEDDIVITF